MNRTTRKEGKYMWLSLVFFVFLTFIVIIWIFSKLIFIIYESKINLETQFVIDFYNYNNNQIVLFKRQGNIDIVSISGINHKVLPATFEIPVDEFVSSNYLVNQSNFSKFFNKEILSNNSFNLIDKAKIFYLLNKSKVSFYLLPKKISPKNSLISSIFIDPSIYLENKTIAIINATGQNGYADNLANLITNMGGNVISMTAAPYIINKSAIVYTNTQSYTLDRINKILNFSVKKDMHSQNSIADITINIGKDQINTTKF